MTSRMAALGVVALAAVAAPDGALAQQIIGSRDTLTARVDSVFRAFDRTESPGCAVGVYGDGRIVYARGYGMANLELGVPITPRTVFDVGSVSKQFTALSLLLLEQDGRLRLDDPVRRYVPELPPYADSVTIRRLLSHTSGIRDYLTLMSLSGWSFEGTSDSSEFLRFITRSETTNFPIGTQYLYSNSGYVLAATIVYRLTGQSLAAFARSRIFEPLGMRDTRFHEDHAAIIPGRAQGYGARGAGFRIAMSQFDNNAGPGGLHTTVEDLSRWIANLDSATVGTRAILDSMQTRSRLANDSAIAYGLGLGVGRLRGLRLVSHSGSWAGYRAMLLRFPDQHLAIACLCNLTTAGPDSLAQQVAAIYLGTQMQPDSAGMWERALLAERPSVVSVDTLRTRAGIWLNTVIGEVRRTRLVGDSLMIGIANSTRLVPLSGTRFRVGRTPTEAAFDGDSAGAPNRLTLRTRGGTTVWRRVAAATPTSAQLAEYAGSYYSRELDVVYAVVADSTRLRVTVAGRALGAPWEPTYRDAFSNGSVYVEFQRDRGGRIASLTVDAGRVRHLLVPRLAAPQRGRGTRT